MKVVQCEKGHFYDADKYDQCPHCLNGLKKVRRDGYKGEISLDLSKMITAQNTPRVIDENATEIIDDLTEVIREDLTEVIDQDLTEVIDEDLTEVIDEDRTEVIK
ncbi:MAG: hypothetical protein Q4D99_05035 [Bacillota bacterium]|nr:hypothetical protein [Bacillota bacterium]